MISFHFYLSACSSGQELKIPCLHLWYKTCYIAYVWKCKTCNANFRWADSNSVMIISAIVRILLLPCDAACVNMIISEDISHISGLRFANSTVPKSIAHQQSLFS